MLTLLFLGGLTLRWATSPRTGSGKWVVVEWAPGLSFEQGAQLLHDRALVADPWAMETYLRLHAAAARPRPGLHLLRDDLSPREVAEYLARLPSRPRRHVLLPEGWNHMQIAERLESAGICPASRFQAVAFEPELVGEWIGAGGSLEGYLFPDTYEFYVNTDCRRVAETLVSRARRQFSRVMQLHAAEAAALRREFGWGEREIVTLASIIEAETGSPDERALIASVFLNRLRNKDFRPLRSLQSDPTAGYGCLVAPDDAPSCAGYGHRVTPAIVRDPQNRYNTYRHPGLPPGPISNPGLRAVEAVLRPATTNYLFFFASGRGHHFFSETFDDHSARIRSSR